MNLMKIRSAHFIFAPSVTYADLKPIYPELYRTFLKESEQMPEDEAAVEIWIDRDMKDLAKNKKPEGFLKQNSIKMVFPIRDGFVEFYIYYKVRTQDIYRIADAIDRVLKKSGLEYQKKYDKMLRYANSK